MSFQDALGTDEINLPKLFVLIYLVFVVLILSWATFNVADLKDIAFPYWALTITPLAIWATAKGITKVKLSKTKHIDFPNPVFYEQKTLFGELPRELKIIMFSGSLILAIFFFFSISGASQLAIVAAPQFQIIEGESVIGIVTIAASAAEDYFFWGFVPAFISGIVVIILVAGFSVSNDTAFKASLPITIFGTPTVFVIFHIAKYGSTNVPATDAVFFFGLISTIYVVLTRTLWLPLFLHAGNNLAITLAGKTTQDTTFLFIITTIIVVAFTIFLYFKTRNKPGGKIK